MKKMFFAILMAATLVIGAGEFRTFANAETSNDDTQINAYIYGDQTSPSVAMGGADGRFFIAWTSKDQDGDGYGIYGLRHDSSGNAVGPEFEVNTYTSGNQYDPSVAMDPNGNFVITWTSNSRHGDWRGIYGQRYDSTGNAVGSEFKVNTHNTGLKDRSSAAMDPQGNFVITWSSHYQDGDGWGVYAKRYDSSGNAVGSEFKVNTTTEGQQEGSSIAIDGDGNFVIAWSSRNQDDDGWGTYGQRYDSSGNAVGSEFEVKTYTPGDKHHHRTSIAMSPQGNSVIAWAGHQQGDEWWGVYGQFYNSYGTKVGQEFKVNTSTIGTQFQPSVAMDANGGFIVTWSSISPEGSGWGIYAQRYDSSGIAVGQEFKVNTVTTSTQSNPSAAIGSNGNAVIAWTSKDQDGDGYGLFMNIFPYK